MATPDRTFLQLPVEIIMIILHNIQDQVSILVLRQTCRLLRSLCEDATVRYRVPTCDRQEATPWYEDPYLKLICCLPDAELAEYEQLLWQDRMCRDCKELRRDTHAYERAVRRMYTPMMCSACVDYHPAYLFSYDERRKAAVRRVCIGRQGNVRLCRHVTINYDILKAKGRPDSMGCEMCKPREGPHNNFALERSLSSTTMGFVMSRKDTLFVCSKVWVDTPNRPPTNQIKDITNIIADFMNLDPPITTCNHAGTSCFPLKRLLLKPDEASTTSHSKLHAWSACAFPDCSLQMAVHAHLIDFDISTANTVYVSHATSPSWLCALDPQSYLSERDQLTRGIMWCRDPVCPYHEDWTPPARPVQAKHFSVQGD
ncbi:hypothetical protein PG991_015582 [Apiospora marii]|uniref:F-box domain-containing protein n=1 Tax=Apiospora marii TaxID=335849 RepID=A0ABR1R256_9PEZI